MLQKIKNYFAQFSGLKHAIASLYATLGVLYLTNSQFSGYVDTLAINLETIMPAWLLKFIVFVLFPVIAFYHQGFAKVVAKIPLVKSVSTSVVLLLLIGMGSALHAQTTTSTGLSASSYAVALNYGGSWSAASLTDERFDLIDFGSTKANHLFIQGQELAAPGPGFSDYLAGVALQPNLTNLLSKTNITAGALKTYFAASVGVNLPTTSTSHMAALFSGGISYQISPTLSWNSFHVAYGKNGSQGFEEVSTGLAIFFGGPK